MDMSTRQHCETVSVLCWSAVFYDYPQINIFIAVVLVRSFLPSVFLVVTAQKEWPRKCVLGHNWGGPQLTLHSLGLLSLGGTVWCFRASCLRRLGRFTEGGHVEMEDCQLLPARI